MDWKNVIFEKGTETIRQMPENYLLAHRTFGRWVCDPDIAANQKICTAIFLELFNYESRYCRNGYALIEILKARKS
jgi:hypothetical protein